MNIELTIDQEDLIVLNALKHHLEQILNDGFDPHETVYNKSLVAGAFLRVIRYYLTEKEYKSYLEGLDE